jgi:dCTP deaminase
MILTDREIENCITSRQIVIEPVPDATMYSSTSVDLRLANTIRRWILGRKTVQGVEEKIISPHAPGYNYNEIAKEFTELIIIDSSGGYILEPGYFILAWTKEYVELPAEFGIAARVEGKSSLARLAVSVHTTAPTIHSGFEGQIQLEMCNHGKLRIKLLPDMKICQLIFEKTLGTPQKGYSGMFSKQTSK